MLPPRVASATLLVNGKEKAAKSIPIAHRAEDFPRPRRIDTLALNGLALPPFFPRHDRVPRSLKRHEAYLPTEQSAPQAHPRLPCAHGHQERPQGARAAARQGPAQADTLGPLRVALPLKSAERHPSTQPRA